MINTGKHNTVVLSSIMLFFSFSMIHEFNFLLQVSSAATMSLPILSYPDIIEEVVAVDEIESDDGFIIIPFFLDNISRKAIPITGLFIARVLTPPPDGA